MNTTQGRQQARNCLVSVTFVSEIIPEDRKLAKQVGSYNNGEFIELFQSQSALQLN